MPRATRRNSAFARKIARLQLRLAPLVPLPSGPPHPAFPKTLMAFHLLTEDELDSIAHYYHQSTPGPWTYHYPAAMNWDKEFLAKGRSAQHSPTNLNKQSGTSRRPSDKDSVWSEDLLKTIEDLRTPVPASLRPEGDNDEDDAFSNSLNPYAGLSDKQRIRIKRRKVGKFIGLLGMETPAVEIAARVEASWNRAVDKNRAQLRRNEEIMLGRRKMM